MVTEQTQIQKLLDTIAGAIWSNVKSYDVPSICVRFGIKTLVKDLERVSALSVYNQ